MALMISSCVTGSRLITGWSRLRNHSGEWHWDKKKKKYFFTFTWTPEPNKIHYIATTFSTVLKEHYAEHPSFGTYEWIGTHWSRMEDRNPLMRPIHQLMDEHDFHTRGNGRMNSIHDQITAYLETRKWDNPNLVTFANGTFDLTTNQLLPGHSQTDWLTFCFPFNNEPEAECPQWLDFIEKTYTKADGTPDPAVVNVLRAAFRWTICPKPVDAAFPYEVAFDVGGLVNHEQRPTASDFEGWEATLIKALQKNLNGGGVN